MEEVDCAETSTEAAVTWLSWISAVVLFVTLLIAMDAAIATAPGGPLLSTSATAPASALIEVLSTA